MKHSFLPSLHHCVILLALTSSLFISAKEDPLMNIEPEENQQITRGPILNRIKNIDECTKKMHNYVKEIDECTHKNHKLSKHIDECTHKTYKCAKDIHHYTKWWTSAKYDTLQYSINDTLAKVCTIPRCDVVITAADIQYTITAPGKYCLGESVDAGGNDIGITINANEVLLDLDGKKLSGSDVNNITILGDHSDIRIQNGILANAGVNDISSVGTTMNVEIHNVDFVSSPTGLSISNAQNITVDKCTFRKHTDCAIGFEDSTAVTLSNSKVNFNTIDTNVFVAMIGRCSCVTFDHVDFCHNQNAANDLDIIQIDASDTCLLTHCRMDNNEAPEGILRALNISNNSKDIMVSACSVNNNLSGNTTDIVLCDSCQKVAFDSCTVNNNVADTGDLSAVSIESSDNCCVLNCLIKGNTSSDAQCNGLVFYNSDSATAKNNIITANTGGSTDPCAAVGIYVIGNSSGATLWNNIVKYNTADTSCGIFLADTTSNIEVLGNSVVGHDTGIEDDSGTDNHIYNNIAHNNTTANYSGVELTIKPTDMSGHWINVDPSSTVLGEFESKICHIASLVDEINTNNP